MSVKITTGSALGVLLLAGCATSNPEKAFQEVKHDIRGRTGHEITWHRNAEQLSEAQNVASQLAGTNLTLNSAILIGLQNNRKLQVEYESIGLSQAEISQATRLKNPEFSGTWRMPTHPGDGINAEYEVAQDVFDLILLPARKGIAVKGMETAKLRVAETVINFIADVQKAYFEVQAAQEILKRFEIILEVNEAATDVTQRQFDAGNINRLELHTELALLAQTKLEVARARAEVRSARERLNRIMGIWGKATAWQIVDPLPQLPATESALADLEQTAISKRPDLAAARQEAELLASTLKLQKRFRYLPGMSVGANAEHDFDHSWISGPSLDVEVPIFNQGQPELARLLSEQRVANRRFEALAVEIRSEVREARDQLISARDMAGFYQSVLLPQRQMLLMESLLHYNAMQISNQALLGAKEREQLAEKEAVETLRDYWIARAELERVCGNVLRGVPPPMVNQKGKPAPEQETEHQHNH